MGSYTKRMKETLLFFDIFGEYVNFNIEGKTSHKSILGLLVSFAILSLVTAFGIKKYSVMVHYQDTKHQDFTGTNENHLKMTDEIFIENFDIAVGAFDSGTT